MPRILVLVLAATWAVAGAVETTPAAVDGSTAPQVEKSESGGEAIKNTKKDWPQPDATGPRALGINQLGHRTQVSPYLKLLNGKCPAVSMQIIVPEVVDPRVQRLNEILAVFGMPALSGDQ